MARRITDDCAMCGACLSVCPRGAVRMGDPKFSIDPEKCQECAECSVVCPMGAIVLDQQVAQMAVQ